MTIARHDHENADRVIAAIAARFNERVSEISAAIRAYIEGDIADLRRDQHTGDLLGASVEANVATILHALRYDLSVADIQAAPAVVDYARRLAQQGVPANALARAYRLGQRRLTELVFAELHTMAIPATDRIGVVERITPMLFEYIDHITEQVLVIYNDEREQWLEGQNNIRAVRAREVLGGRMTIDVDAATEAIRYPLRWHHLALVLWYRESEIDSDVIPGLQRFVRDLADFLGAASSPLVVAADRGSVWAWLPYRSAQTGLGAGIRKFVSARRDAPDIAIGTLAEGIEGFRYSHRSAQRAYSVALAHELSTPSVVAAEDPGLTTAALLGGIIDEARYWVGEVLGDLAGDNDNDKRLRDTLRVFLRTGSSYKAAANELNLHFNSVKYRVGRAIARRGRAIDTDRLDVELALLVCHWYGRPVLRPDPKQ
ncbi:PucR family transcriptional regulator [Nocardia jinanensis]|uniref:ABC transporter substrate-binding protein n=1 Tax=Nocardia jinanensis TaxID=382504 RepID=A0A917VW17_9NOCA|nr:helix-turn-helix domain-containing protein [Nocardia jinanensis]GGL19734.1 ABC transporter substrate-binding protein [Nocardia jinanensis]